MLSLLIYLVFGLIVGSLARLIVAGREPGGWVVSIVIGVAGSMLGGFMGREFGLYRYGESAGFVLSLIGAICVVAIYHAVTVSRAPRGA
jgi:uncharacterized membrane protein YeaQ/YmgE (transglycosylase-associated protein family)